MTPQKRTLNLAALAVSGALLASAAGYAQDRQADPQKDADRSQQTDRPQADSSKMGQARAGLPEGIKWSDKQADIDPVRGLIDGIAGAAVADNGFDDVVERLVDQDRNRIGEWIDEGENKKFTELNESAKRFREAYKVKYNKDFDFDEQALVGLVAIEGEVQDPKLVAQTWPVAPTAGMARAAEDGRVAGGQDVTDTQGNIEKGRQVAIAILPAPRGALEKSGTPQDRPDAAADRRSGDPAQQEGDARLAGAGIQPDAPALGTGIRISLIHEFPGSWKVDVPNQRAPQQVSGDLARRLGQLSDANQNWPSDETQLHQTVAYAVMCALYGVEAPGHQPMNGTPRPAAGGDPMDDR